MGRQPTQDHRWTLEGQIRDLYLSGKIEADEFEVLIDCYVRGLKVEHPDLPIFLPGFMTEALER